MTTYISEQMTKYFFFIWGKTLRQGMFSYSSDVCSYYMRKFITSFILLKIYPLPFLHPYILLFCLNSYQISLVRLTPMNLRGSVRVITDRKLKQEIPSCPHSPSPLALLLQKRYLKVFCPHTGWRMKRDSIDSEHIKDCGKIYLQGRKEVKN